MRPRKVSAPLMGGHQADERQQVLDAKTGPTAPDVEVRIGRNDVRPAERDGAKDAIRVLNGDSVLAPELLRHDQSKGLPPERMEGMDDPNLRLINGTRCS
jgi:hypothetical protein